VSKTNDDGVKEEVDKQVSLPELMFGAGCVWSCVCPSSARGRCYDFKNVFAEKFGENMGGVFFAQMTASFLKIDHNIGFWEKRRFFRRK
jgi:hypothetical protein